MYDNKKATEYVVRYIGGSDLINELEQKGNSDDVDEIIRVIDQEMFYIKLNYGERQRNEDLKILNKLRSNSKKQKAIGILQVIYYVRCNMFHGHKMFIEYQRTLVVPLANILQSVNEILYERLSN